MKFQYFTTLSLAAAVLSSSALSSFAEPPESSGSPGGPPLVEGRRGGGSSPEEREKFRAVMEKVRKDPAVAESQKAQRSANREYNETLNKAILEKDPSLKDLLPAGGRPPGPRGGGEKPPGPPPAASEEDNQQAEPGRGGRGPRGEGRGRGGKRLSPEDQAKLDAAREEARKNPGVAAAETRRDDANKKLKEAMKAAILKEDPSLEPMAERMADRMSRGGMMGRGPRREGPPGGGRPPGGEEGKPKGPPPVVEEGEPE